MKEEERTIESKCTVKDKGKALNAWNLSTISFFFGREGQRMKGR